MNDTTNKSEEAQPQSNEEESEGQDRSEDLAFLLEQEKERADKNLANWQRAQADLSNYKKRVDQEKQELAKFANAALIGSMLTLVDDFERARATIPDSILGMTWVEGLFLIERKLASTLEAVGLSEIKALGEDFDPNLHEAVMHGGRTGGQDCRGVPEGVQAPRSCNTTCHGEGGAGRSGGGNRFGRRTTRARVGLLL